MSNNDVAITVNTFMLNSAPTLVAATPLAYELLKSLAQTLTCKIGTSKEHALYVMNKKYSHLYDVKVIEAIIREGGDDFVANRIEENRHRRAAKRAVVGQPMLLSV